MPSFVPYFNADEDPITPDRWFGTEEPTLEELFDHTREREERAHLHDLPSQSATVGTRRRGCPPPPPSREAPAGTHLQEAV
jgi:hypothetical protein